MANEFQKRPSEILEIEDNYTAFCFDEACIFIKHKLKEKKTPYWGDKQTNNSELINQLKGRR